MLKSYFLIAWRNLLRHRTYTLINITGLSIGVTCCLIIIIFIRYETSFDQSHALADDTYRVVQHTQRPDEVFYWNTTAYPLAQALRDDFGNQIKVTQAAGPMTRTFSVQGKEAGEINRFEDDYALYVDPSYPGIFNITWLAGNANTALGQPNSIVLTEDLARKCFGTSDYNAMLGKSILLNNQDALTVTGVVQNAPGNVSLRYHMLIPYEFFKRNNPYPANNWSGNYQGTTFVVLNKNTDPAGLNKTINTWKAKYLKPEDNARISYRLQPLREVHTETRYGSSPKSYTMPATVVRTAWIVAALILLIASINFVNLATALATTRAREVGIRKVMGSTRPALIRQFIAENAILIGLTLMFCATITPIMVDLLNKGLTIINLALVFRAADALLLVGIGAIVTLLAAVYPAVTITEFKPAAVLKNKVTLASSRGMSLRKSLIVLQFTFVQVFIMATLVAALQMTHFQNQDLGFSAASIVSCPAFDVDKHTSLQQQLLQNPNIEAITFASGPPLSVDNIAYGTTFRKPGQPESEAFASDMKACDTSYLRMYGLKLITGRNFTTAKWPFDEFIITEKTASMLGWTPEEALGRKIVINEGEATVVGVIEDFHNTSLQYETSACILMNWTALQDHAYIKLNTATARTAQTLAAIEHSWKKVYPDRVYKYNFVTDAMAREYTVENLVFNGITTAALLSIGIGCLGLLGMVSFMALRKTKEIGIRKVLGAATMHIVTLFSKEFVGLVLIAFAIATPVAYYGMQQWLLNFANRIELSWWIFALAGVAAQFIALATILFQSLKAAMANPVDAIKNE